MLLIRSSVNTAALMLPNPTCNVSESYPRLMLANFANDFQCQIETVSPEDNVQFPSGAGDMQLIQIRY